VPFQELVENLNDAIFALDTEGRIVYISPAVERFTKYKPEEFVGQPFSRFIVPEDLLDLVANFHQTLEGSLSPSEFRVVARDGEIRHLRSSSRPRTEDGRVVGLTGILTDITERVKVDAELKAARTDLERRVEERTRELMLSNLSLHAEIAERHRAERERQNLEGKIQEAQRLESLGLLAGGIAHDFNNLLNAIQGHLELSAMDLPEDSSIQKRLGKASKACRAAADLCQQMLAFSGRGHFQIKPLDLNESVADIARMLEVSISKKAMLQVQLADRLPAIQADSSQLQQVIMNLVVNASESLGTQSGTITLRTSLVQAYREYLASARIAEELPEGDYVCLEVEDNGCGMSPDTLSRLFDPFFTTKFTGRGLGLAAVLGIIRGHKGGIRVKSQPGEGSTFSILFPAFGAVVNKPVLAPVSEAWRGCGTILLVEDEAVLREVGKEFLERLGFQTLTARDGLEAVEQFQAHREALVCILLDLTMPRMDGMEAFQELKKLGCRVPVVLVSGFAERDVAEGMEELGLAGFVQKPYTRAMLVAKLAEVLDNQ